MIFLMGQELGAVATESETEMNIQFMHELLGNSNEATTRKIAKHLGWSNKHSSMSPCESYSNAKAEQKK